MGGAFDGCYSFQRDSLGHETDTYVTQIITKRDSLRVKNLCSIHNFNLTTISLTLTYFLFHYNCFIFIYSVSKKIPFVSQITLHSLQVLYCLKVIFHYPAVVCRIVKYQLKVAYAEFLVLAQST